MTSRAWDRSFDVVVVGSGAAGLLAALVARDRGHTVVLIEKESQWGGTSAYSGGGLWMPNNPLMARDGVADSPERALRYLDEVVGEVGPASSPERRRAFVETAPQVVAWLEARGFRWLRAAEYPDYYPDRPGGMIGRAVEPAVFDGHALGSWLDTLASPPGFPRIAMASGEVRHLPIALRTPKSFAGTSRVMLRTAWWMLRRRVPLALGAGLVGQLMALLQAHGVPVWLESPLVSLVDEDGRVTGIVADRRGERLRIHARAGVVLTAGGFARNPALRREHHGVDDAWTSVSPGDTGDAILAGTALDAATALMDDAWWGPTFMMPDGNPAFSVYERSMPGCILVTDAGRRFTNESASYVDVAHDMLELNPGGPPAPTWLVLDAHHRRRYLFGQAPPGLTPRAWLESGFLQRADSLDALARQCGIDPDGLQRTVLRFNELARLGEDLDFQRGATAYDRYYGDPTVRPNPNLAPIATGPFYAARMVPGDLGTKGGLLTDEHARVLRTDGAPIPGLYAAGNTTASVMGRTYPGPGATLAASTTFAWLGAQHAIDRLERDTRAARPRRDLPTPQDSQASRAADEPVLPIAPARAP